VTYGKTVMTRLALCATLAAASACGSDSPTAPGGGGGSGGPGPVGATITIGANDTVSPASVTINPGESVTFVNNGSQPHEMTSDPHPAHTDCPALNAVGLVNVGQSRTSNALTTSRSCGFHDHRNDSAAGLRGSVVVR
jgi:plastocyanin